MSRFNRFFVSVGFALFAVFAVVAVVRGSGEPPLRSDWEEVLSCLELNDLVETRLDRPENVGLYQSVFGKYLGEDACQNDHHVDVQKVFAWAFSPVKWFTGEVDGSQTEQAQLSGWGDGFSEAVTLPQGVYSAEATWEWIGTPITNVYGAVIFDMELVVIGDDSNSVVTIPLNSRPSYDTTATTGESREQFEITSPSAKVFIGVDPLPSIREPRQVWATWNVVFKKVG